MIYGYSPFSWTGDTVAAEIKPKFVVDQKVNMLAGRAVIKARRNNGGWEYGLQYPGITKDSGSLIWYREANIG